MRMILGLALAMLPAAGNAESGISILSIYSGVGTAQGGALNAMLDDMQSQGYRTEPISSQLILGFESMWCGSGNTCVGARLGIRTSRAQAETQQSVYYLFWGWDEMKVGSKYSAISIPILFGIRLPLIVGAKCWANAGLFAGPSLMILRTQKYKIESGLFGGENEKVISTKWANTGTFSGEIMLGGAMFVGESQALNLDLGMRFDSAKIRLTAPIGSGRTDTLSLSGIFATLSYYWFFF